MSWRCVLLRPGSLGRFLWVHSHMAQLLWTLPLCPALSLLRPQPGLSTISSDTYIITWQCTENMALLTLLWRILRRFGHRRPSNLPGFLNCLCSCMSSRAVPKLTSSNCAGVGKSVPCLGPVQAECVLLIGETLARLQPNACVSPTSLQLTKHKQNAPHRMFFQGNQRRHLQDGPVLLGFTVLSRCN